MPIKQSKYKNPEMVSGKQCVSYMKIQSLIDAVEECERCNKAARNAYERMMSVRSKMTDYDWRVFKRLCEQMRERGEQT